MADSPEHKFISKSLDETLSDFSETKLLGIQEAQRRTFDYGCVLLRDFSRPLVSQVLWSHQEGIEKDIRTLLFDAGSSLKLYFVRDNVKNRAKIDEILKAFREQPSTAPLLRGLRLIPVPDAFDADSLDHQIWMDAFIRSRISSDLLFAVVFGKLTAADIATFSDHGGPMGLKFAALQLITASGYDHGPTFESAVGSRGSPLREVLTMLGGTGLVGKIRNTNIKVPTLKGRFLLDLCRRIMFERLYRTDWSDELKTIMLHLKLVAPEWGAEITPENCRQNTVHELLFSMHYCKSQFGRDLMDGIDPNSPIFHSDFSWKRFVTKGYFDVTGKFWDDSDDLDLFQ